MKAHPQLQRRDEDVIYELRVNVVQAARVNPGLFTGRRRGSAKDDAWED